MPDTKSRPITNGLSDSYLILAIRGMVETIRAASASPAALAQEVATLNSYLDIILNRLRSAHETERELRDLLGIIEQFTNVDEILRNHRALIRERREVIDA